MMAIKKSIARQRKIKVHQGFTLIELMIALGIIAILVAVALPAYQNTMIDSRRADAKIALTDAAARQERWFTENNGYTTNVNNIGGSDGSLKSPDEHYAITISTPCGDTTCFTLTATPQGAQADDTYCGNLTLTHLGEKGNSGAADVEECW